MRQGGELSLWGCGQRICTGLRSVWSPKGPSGRRCAPRRGSSEAYVPCARAPSWRARCCGPSACGHWAVPLWDPFPGGGGGALSSVAREPLAQGEAAGPQGPGWCCPTSLGWEGGGLGLGEVCSGKEEGSVGRAEYAPPPPSSIPGIGGSRPGLAEGCRREGVGHRGPRPLSPRL